MRKADDFFMFLVNNRKFVKGLGGQKKNVVVDAINRQSQGSRELCCVAATHIHLRLQRSTVQLPARSLIIFSYSM